MEIIVCDICCNRIKMNGHKATFTKCNAIFNDIENTYDICDDCYNRAISLWDKNRADIKINISK